VGAETILTEQSVDASPAARLQPKIQLLFRQRPITGVKREPAILKIKVKETGPKE
jgi:hypothetical protein